MSLEKLKQYIKQHSFNYNNTIAMFIMKNSTEYQFIEEFVYKITYLSWYKFNIHPIYNMFINEIKPINEYVKFIIFSFGSIQNNYNNKYEFKLLDIETIFRYTIENNRKGIINNTWIPH